VRKPRMPIPWFVANGLLIGALFAGTSVVGQPAPTPAAPATRTPYSAGMGEIMAFGVQPRHVKMAIAAKAGDWAYAAYALKELGESFDRIPRANPIFRGQPAAEFFAGFIKEPMAALGQAINATDMAHFNVAYAQLTQGCNACHQQTGRGMVVIKVPDAPGAYSDQDFKPSKP
jgi:hypothetical protein